MDSVDEVIGWRYRGHMLIQIEYKGKTYLCTVMTDWVDMIEELDGGGVMDESDPLYDTIAALALEAINE